MRLMAGTASFVASPVPLVNQHQSPAAHLHSTWTIPRGVMTTAFFGRSRLSNVME